MECGSCGSINRDGARFCIGCGAPFAPRCPSCGNELPDAAKFCDACGTPLHQTIPAPIGAPTRKIVTVLFSDLTGSTALAERMDPESFRAIMTPVYASMRVEVESRGGVVTKFVGDGVMAAFGVPDIREDDAMRAVDAAVGMQQAIARLSLDLPVGLSLKVGVNTGEVVVGSGDEDIVGDCINVAARFEGAAAPGEVLVGEETWRLTRSSATYEPVAPLTLKGKAEPVPAFRLVSLERTQEAGTATFVGRDDELTRLQRSFDEAVESQSARLVTIVGSPGLGKTRLARELGASLADRALVVETRCDAAGTATFAPVADALRTAAGIDESASPDEVLDAVRALLPDDDDRERITARAAAILGAGEPGSTEETFWAIRRIVENAAKAQPLVLVLDDLHWGEPLLLDLVEHLAEWNKTSPVLIVVTGRPELREMRPRLTDGAISLEGLDGGATEALACGLLGTDRVPRELLARLPASTEGNPLFVREFVRMLVDDGILRRSDDGWVATIDVDAIQVPPTIHSLLAARVDRLKPNERTVLELASVIGKEFYMGAIAEIAPEAVKVDLSAHLESLRRKELVEPSGAYWIDEPVFRFHHALIQDAAYKRLLKESRAELHERVAGWLERKTGGLLGEHDELIGYHLEQAHECRKQLGGNADLLRELAAKSGRLLASAARTALDLDDLPAAAGLSGRALVRLEPEDEARADVLLLRCEALLATGDVARAADAVAELESVAASSPRLLAWATCFAGELATMTDPSRLRETEERVSAAAEELIALKDPAGAAKAYTVQAISLAGLGRVAACESALDSALNAAREAGDRRRVTAVLAFAPVAALWGPSPVSRAGGRCLDIVRLLRITTGSPAVEATSERCQAVLESFRGRAPAARRMLERVRAKVEELGLRQGLFDTEMFSGIVELVAGDPAAAEDHLRAAHAGFRAMGNDLSTARSAALLARALLATGDETEAYRFVVESEHLGGDDLKNGIAWRAVRAELLARRGELDEARRLAEEAVEIASRTDALVDHADACVALAEVCRRAGDAEGAQRASEAALALYERKGATAYVEGVRARPIETAAPDVATLEPSNRCSQLAFAWLRRIAAGDVSEISAALTETSRIEDRRPLGGDPAVGARACSAYVRSMVDVGITRIEGRVLATRGNTLHLNRGLLDNPDAPGGGFETEVLGLWEIDERGRLVVCILFDVDRLEDALDELDARYAAGEGAASAEVSAVPVALKPNRALRVASAWAVFLAEGRVDEFVAMFAPDGIFIDHRAMFRERPIVGRTDARAMAKAINEIGTKGVTGVPLATRGEDLALARIEFRGRDQGAQTFGNDLLMVFEVNDADQIVYCEGFEPDELERAIAALDVRYAARSISDLMNDCVRVNERGLRALVDGDIQAAGDLMAEDYVWSDRRTGMGAEGDKKAALESNRLIHQLGRLEANAATVAVRGERSALIRETLRGEAEQGWETEILFLSEINDDGLLASSVVYDSSDLHQALRELDERFIAAEGAPFRETLRFAASFQEAINEGDWERCRSLIADDVVDVDRRPAYFGEVHGIEALLDSVKAMERLVEMRMYARIIAAVRADGWVANVVSEGVTDEGAAVEVDYWVVSTVVAGKLRRNERFAPDQKDAALARFEELSVKSPEDMDADLTVLDARHSQEVWSQENRCVDVAREYVDAMVRHDWDAVAEMTAEDAVGEDRRPMFASRMEGKEAVLEGARGVNAAAISIDVTATRGDNHALLRELFVGPLGEVEVLFVWEIDAAGRVAYTGVFAVDDIDEALRGLHERFAASLEPAVAATVRLGQRYFDAANRFDGAVMREILADDVVEVDHQPVSWPDRIGPDAVIDPVLAIQALMPDMKMRISHVRVATERFTVAQISISGHSADGGEVEFAMTILAEFRSGRIIRMERFPEDAVDRAIARLDELSKASDFVELDNRAVRTWRACCDAIEQGDWDRLSVLCRDDVVSETRRPGLGHITSGSEKFIDDLMAAREVGVTRLALTPLAVRGERLVLGRVIASGDRPDLYAVELLNLLEVDDAGLLVREVLFDPEDFDIALAELEKKYAAGASDEAPLENLATEAVRRSVDANVRMDWTAYAQSLAREYRFEDRRLGLGVALGAEETVEQAKLIVSLGVEDVSIDVVAVRGSSLALVRLVFSSKAVDVEAELLFVQEADEHRRLTLGIAFDPTDAVAAFRELDERYLAGEGADLADIIRWSMEVTRCLCSHDWVAYRALLHPDLRFVDHRSASLGPLSSADALIAAHRALVGVLPDATVGIARFEAIDDRRLLVRTVITGFSADGGFVDLSLLATNSWRDGLVDRLDFFALEEMEVARARYEELAESNAASTALARVAALARDLDFDGVRDLLAEGFVREDRRSGLSGVVDREGLVRSLRVGADLGVRLSITPIATHGERLALAKIAFSDETNEVVFFSVYETDDSGLLVRATNFDTLDEAQMAFDADAVENRCSRAVEAMFVRSRDGGWDGIEELFARDAHYDDRRAGLSWVSYGRDELIANAKLANAMSAPALRTVAVKGEDLALVHLSWSHRFDVDVLALYELDPDGRFVGCTAFDMDGLDDAMALLENLAGRTEPRNACTRFVRRFFDLRSRGETPEAVALLSPDIVMDDRRSGIGWRLEGRDAVAQNLAEITSRNWFVRVIATRGDRLALIETRFEAKNGFELNVLSVIEIDEEGLETATIVFDADDVDGAHAELERRSAGSPLENAASRATARFMEAFDHRRWDAVRSMITDEHEHDDRRPGLRGHSIGADRTTEVFKLMSTALGLVRMEFRVLAIRGERLALVHGLVVDGRDNEIELLVLNEVGESGLIIRTVYFSSDDSDDAYVELDRRFLEEAMAAYSGGDWELLRSMAAPDVELIDHALIGLGRVEGFDRWVEGQVALRNLIAGFQARIVSEVAVRPGAFLVVFEITGKNAEGGAVTDQSLFIGRLRDGLFASMETYELAQQDEALARFKELSG